MNPVVAEAPQERPSSGFAALHARYRRPLRRYFASYRLNSADADDLTQEVFLRLARSAVRDVLRTPDAFVFTLARNLVRDRARRLHHRAASRSVPLDEIELPCANAPPEDAVDATERLRRAAAVLADLKPAARRAFLMHRIDGCSYAEIAASMCVSVSMIEKHVMAAIAALRLVED